MSKYAIIVPSYNCASFVTETLQSLLAQGDALKRCDFVVLTDDASQDDTIEVAKAAWTGPIPLVVYDAPKNRGEYGNMNECIARLPDHIEWYLVMHADNMAKPGWLEALLNAADAADERVGTIFTSWDSLHEDGSITKGEYRQPPTIERITGDKAEALSTIQRGCWWHISSCVSRVAMYREIGGLPLGLRLKGDWDFLLRLQRAGWDVEYIPTAYMLYRDNPAGSSSISFRTHRDIYETLTVVRRHQAAVASAGQVSAYHLRQFSTLARRFFGGIGRGQWERAARTIPTTGFVIASWAGCLRDQWLGRRRFDWASSTDAQAQSRLGFLAHRMKQFYGLPETRRVYQKMVDDEASLQPLTEGELRKAVLKGSPEHLMEVGCGSGRIYERLVNEGMQGQYTGVEVSPEVIAGNQARWPTTPWHVGTGDTLPVPLESQDCVFAFYVLEHTAHPQRFLENLLARVKPGGRLLVVFPDMIVSRIFGSQALGWDARTAKEHLRAGRLFHALVRIWDTRIRMPMALRHARRKVGPFPINLSPQCLEPGIRIEPDVDAIYIASRDEVAEWAMGQGCQVSFPGGVEHQQLVVNALVEITKPVAA